MASSVARIRLVRCPQCFKVLTEFSNIPIYKCGACGACLRAKNFNPSRNQTGNISMDVFSNGSILQQDRAVNHSLSSGNDAKPTTPASHTSSVPETRIVKHEDVIPSGTGKTKSEHKRSELESTLPVDQLAFIQDDTSFTDPNQLNEGSCSNEEHERFLKLSPQTHGNLKSKEKYIHSSSSSSSNGVPDQYTLLSKRTFRNKKAPTSLNSSDKGIAEDARISMQKTMVRRESFASDEFYSAENWMDTDDRGISKYFSKNSSSQAASIRCQYDHTELMKKVDEIRDKVVALFEKTSELEQGLGFRGIHQTNKHLCCCPLYHQVSCCVCPHKTISHPRKQTKLREPRKRHCLPVSGGAPFIICSSCFNLLRLPSDFLVSSKRQMHKLQCGACLRVLVFSFRARATSPTEVKHPPSKASTSLNDDPVSYQENGSLIDRSTQPKQVTSCLAESSSRLKEAREKHERIGYSLHQLMGYGSARKLLFSGSSTAKNG